MLRFIHISDSHIEAGGSTNNSSVPEGGLQCDKACKNARELRSVIDAINVKISEGLSVDFLAHTGDICNSDDKKNDNGSSFRSAISIMDSCEIEKVYVNGNHDNLSYVTNVRDREFSRVGNKMEFEKYLTPELTGSYSARFDNYRILVLDARPQRVDFSAEVFSKNTSISSCSSPEPDGDQPADPAGYLLPTELNRIEELLDECKSQVVVFMHYPPVKLDCSWVDRNMCVSNGEQLHKIFAAHADKISGVFFGHVHHGIQAIVDNVLYVSSGAVSMQFDTSAHLQKHEISLDSGAKFSLVAIDKQRVIVKQYSIGCFETD